MKKAKKILSFVITTAFMINTCLFATNLSTNTLGAILASQDTSKQDGPADILVDPIGGGASSRYFKGRVSC